MSHTDHVPLEAMNIELSRQESAQQAIILELSKQESRSSAGPDHVTEHALFTWLITDLSGD